MFVRHKEMKTIMQSCTVTHDNAEIISTVKLVSGDENVGSIFNFVTKRGSCLGKNSKLAGPSRDRVCVTWKYPSCVLHGVTQLENFICSYNKKFSAS